MRESITDNMTAVAITFLIVTITGTLQSNSQQPFSTSLMAVLDELPVYGLSLLVIVLEAVNLIYRRVRRASYKKGQVQAEADG